MPSKEEMIQAVNIALDEFDILCKDREPVALFRDYITNDKREKEIYFHTLQTNLLTAKKNLLTFNQKLDAAIQTIMEYNLEQLKND